MTHSFENTYFIFLNVLIWILSKKKVRKILLKTEPSEYSQSRYSGDMNLEIP